MSKVLEFENVIRSYKKGTLALDSVSLSMEQGDVVGLLGRNGAGKTTLINTAIGILRPDEGKVQVFGISPFQKPVEVKRRLGYVPETQTMPGFYTVGQMIAFHRHLFRDWDEVLANQLLERFELPLNKKIAQLSKGQARQVALFAQSAIDRNYCCSMNLPLDLILQRVGSFLKYPFNC